MATKKALFVEGNRDVKSIVCLDKNTPQSFNKDTQRGKAKETYRRYRYNGIVFICDDETFFSTPVAEIGYVKLLSYEETIQDENGVDVMVDRLEFDSYGLKSEDLAEREHIVAMEQVGKDAFAGITPELLAKLEAIEIASVTG